MIRSLLFAPGDSERKITKAAQSRADAVIVDLEDSVALENKAEARKTTSEYLRARQASQPLCFVRVNPPGSELLLQDLAAVVAGAPYGIVIPKCESQEQVDTIGHYLSALEAREGLPIGSIRLLAIATETPAAVLALSGGGLSHPRLFGLLWGAEDLSAELGSSRTRDATGGYAPPFTLSRDLCLYAAAAVDATPIDAVYTSLDDSEGLATEVEVARNMGFQAKAAIHPNQIDIINSGFTPTEEELDWARRILALREDGSGVATLDGRMIDKPHFLRAQRLLRLAEQIKPEGQPL
ncbi:CoA ester lyase [Aquisalimonas lutea]|uniref:HpcH/HpaI aldolase/citrate lyase family protein n=1 Tax=Aquisalimonas lutea TaxID=1327750 RepID=UPI0025B30DF2|nr:CoA ester lyase [Aquisalimonas lutea]MDN3519711.1 CoA ester lyase [Aquisalimonas lutea]